MALPYFQVDIPKEISLVEWESPSYLLPTIVNPSNKNYSIKFNWKKN